MAYYRAGLQNVGSYQVGGTPYLTGGVVSTDEVKIEFPQVTKNVLVSNTSGSIGIRVHFNSTGSGNVISGHHYFTLSNKGDNVTFNQNAEKSISPLRPPARMVLSNWWQI